MTKNKSIIINVLFCIAAILGIMIIRTIFMPTIISGKSMEPHFKEKQLVIMHIYVDINRFDCITAKVDGKQLFKRVIGLPGEKVEYKDNQLYINNTLIQDVFAVGKTEDFSITLANDEYFCMGDNREVSKDSRHLGAFKSSQIIGKKNGGDYGKEKERSKS